MNFSKHIVILTPGFAANEADSSCIPPLQAYVRALSAAHPNWRISIVALHYPFRTQEYSWHGLSVHPLGGQNARGLAKIRLWRRALRQLKALDTAQSIDVLHSFWLLECTWLAQRFARRRNIRVVATLQGQDALPGNRYLRRLDPNQMQVVAISQRGLRQLERTWERKVAGQVLPWGIAAPDHLAEDRNIDLVGVGSLVPVKQWSLWLDVVERVARQRPAVRAVLIGGGPEEAQLKGRIREKGLEEQISLKGQMDREEVMEWIGKSKMLLHTARYEGQAYVFNEALAAGCAIVSTPVGIAQAAPHWQVAENAPELAQSALDFLASPPPYESRLPYSIASTVEGYAGIYFP